MSLLIYPNPVNVFLTIFVEHTDLNDLFYQLYDLNGKLLETKNITNSETKIVIENYASTLLFLKIIKDKKELKTYKITKNN